MKSAPSACRAALSGLLMAGLAGCASVQDSVVRHTDANRVQAEAMNQQLLLNIVRARNREALHFSRIPEIVLPLPSSTLASLAIPFGNATNKEYTLSGQVSAPAAAARVVPQDSQEFMQGIQQPVTPSLLGFYLDQGWPRRLVLTLFVEQIELQNGSERLFLDGHPDSIRRDDFYQMIDALAELRVAVVPSKRPADYQARLFGPALPASAASPLAGLAAVRSAGLGIRTDDVSQTIRVLKPETASMLRLGRQDCRPVGPSARQLPAGPQLQDWAGALLDALNGHAIAFTGDVAPAAEPTVAAGPAMTLTLRSPSAMIYYLGELSRPKASADSDARVPSQHLPDAGQRPAATPLLQCDGHADASKDRDHAAQLRPMRLQVSPEGVTSPTHCKDASSALPLSAQSTYVAVSHRGCRYAVALGLDGDRSSQAMALVGEVLQLQYKGVAAPSTVRVTLP